MSYSKEYYLENKDRIKEHRKKWREKNKDSISKYHREWQQRNRERLNEYLRERYARLKKKPKLSEEEIISKRKAKYKESLEKYSKKNREKIVEYNRKKYHSSEEFRLKAKERLKDWLKMKHLEEQTWVITGPDKDGLWSGYLNTDSSINAKQNTLNKLMKSLHQIRDSRKLQYVKNEAL